MTTYSNLSNVCTALANHGKNFQQYLDSGPTKTARQAAATEIGALCDAMTGYSGNTFTNLKSLATVLCKDNEVQDELSHTALSTRNGARTEWTQLITDINAWEVSEGLAAGSYGNATTLMNLVLAAGMPNDLGQWSDKLTPLQMTNAATAISNLVTVLNANTFSLDVYAQQPDFFLDAGLGISYATTGTGTDVGTGTDEGIITWTSRKVGGVAGLEFDAYGNVGYLPSVSDLNDKPALFLISDAYLEYLGEVLSNNAGDLLMVILPAVDATTGIVMAQSDKSEADHYYYVARYSSGFVFRCLGDEGAAAASAQTGSTALAAGTAYCLTVSCSTARVLSSRLNGAVETVNGNDANTYWFGRPTGVDSTQIGCRILSGSASGFFTGYIAAIVGFDSQDDTKRNAVETALMTRYGISA